MAHNSEAIRLAEASDWKGLLRLIELAPELARESGDYGMLPIHWACTEAQVPTALLDRLLTAYPDGARAKNAVHLLPLHIAIRARVAPHLLRRLLAANPHAARVRTPDGLSTVELAKQVGGFSDDALKLLLDAYNECSPEQEDDMGDGSRESRGEQGSSGAARSENNRDDVDVVADDDEDNNNNKSDDDDGDKRATTLSRPTRQGYQLLSTTSKKELLSSSPVVGAPDRYELLQSHDESDSDAFLDDDQEWLSTPRMINRITSTGTMEGVGSPLMRSLSLLSDEGTVDSPHDGNLVSPSSTSTSSRARSTSSVNSAPLPLTTPIAPPLHKQMQGPFQRKHSLDYHHTAASRQSQESLARRSQTQLQTRSGVPAQRGGRHQSLPVIPTFEDFRVHLPITNSRDHQQYHRDTYHDRSSGEEEGESGNRGRFQRFASSFRRNSSRDADDGADGLNYDLNGLHHFESPPAWKRDDECSICHANFGVFKHRHHCRNCGKSICSQHSADRKVSMTSKGFKTPQRVCVTCFAMLTHQQSRSKNEFDAVLDAAGLGGPNPVAAFAMQQLQLHQQQQQQQHYAQGTQALRSPQYTSPVGNGSSPTGTLGSTSHSSLYQQQHQLPGAYLGTGSGGDPAVVTAAAMRKDHMLQNQVRELRQLVAAQQKQIEMLAQNNLQMQQQVLEQEELKAETMLLITQLMTRVSVLELKKHEQQEEEEGDDAESE